MTTPQERKQEEREVRRRRIQRAARVVFSERGYTKTSIEQVAKQAGLSVGAIYLYFRSKEDLYLSLLEETLEVFQTELNHIRSSGEFRAGERLGAVWSFLTRWAGADLEATRVLRLVGAPGVREQLSDEVVARLGASLSAVRDQIAAVVQDAAAAGAYRTVDPRATADLVWSVLLGLLQLVDQRGNLGLPGPSFADSARAAFAAIEGALRTAQAGMAEAA
jgi:AcrR family transcriptional regulator